MPPRNGGCLRTIPQLLTRRLVIPRQQRISRHGDTSSPDSGRSPCATAYLCGQRAGSQGDGPGSPDIDVSSGTTAPNRREDRGPPRMMDQLRGQGPVSRDDGPPSRNNGASPGTMRCLRRRQRVFRRLGAVTAECQALRAPLGLPAEEGRPEPQPPPPAAARRADARNTRPPRCRRAPAQRRTRS